MFTKQKIFFLSQMLWYASVVSLLVCFISGKDCLLLQNADSSDDEGLPSRSVKPKSDPSSREEVDSSSLIATEAATKKFEKAERKRSMSYFTKPFLNQI